jgi:CheY-specific phosphatase CheX
MSEIMSEQNSFPPETIALLKSKVVDITKETIENMTFLETLYSENKTLYDEHLVRLRAEILVNAPFAGEIRIIIPVSLAIRFASNLFTLKEEEISEEILNDVIGELINIIAGGLMKEITPSDKKFELGIPQIGPDVFIGAIASSFDIEFDVEGSPFWLVLMGEGFFFV